MGRRRYDCVFHTLSLCVLSFPRAQELREKQVEGNICMEANEADTFLKFFPLLHAYIYTQIYCIRTIIRFNPLILFSFTASWLLFFCSLLRNSNKTISITNSNTRAKKRFKRPFTPCTRLQIHLLWFSICSSCFAFILFFFCLNTHK